LRIAHIRRVDLLVPFSVAELDFPVAVPTLDDDGDEEDSSATVDTRFHKTARSKNEDLEFLAARPPLLVDRVDWGVQ
jgi:hypothetical protein